MRKEKKYNYLYKTTCSLTKRFYYGMHSTDKLDDSYLGSGSELSRSVKKYGKEKHSKEILSYFKTRKELKKGEADLITEEVRHNPQCMNLALGGGGSDYATFLATVKDKDGNTFNVMKDDPRYLSGELVHITTGVVMVKDKEGNTFSVKKDDPRYLSGALVGVTKGFMPSKDKKGNIIYVSIEDPRFLSGQIVNLMKNKIVVRDKNGNSFSIDKDDSRYLSGELVAIAKNRILKKETKNKIGKANSISQKGHRNSQFGTIWITNKKETKKIKKDEFIPKGWYKGRK
jgi:hypothetical protein